MKNEFTEQLTAVTFLYGNTEAAGDAMRCAASAAEEGFDTCAVPAADFYLQEADPAARRETSAHLNKHTLYISDDPEVTARLHREGYPCAAWLREGGPTAFPEIDFLLTDPADMERPDYLKIHSRALGLPWEIARTESFYLRELTEADAPALLSLLAEDDSPDFLSLKSDAGDNKKAEQKLRTYIDTVYSFFDFGMWGICLTENQELIGLAGFSLTEDTAMPELGYFIGRTYRRKGFAVAACRAILEFSFPYFSFPEICLKIHASNASSKALAHKLGAALRSVRGNEEFYFLTAKSVRAALFRSGRRE